jgi:hypothetical protein
VFITIKEFAKYIHGEKLVKGKRNNKLNAIRDIFAGVTVEGMYGRNFLPMLELYASSFCLHDLADFYDVIRQYCCICH